MNYRVAAWGISHCGPQIVVFRSQPKTIAALEIEEINAYAATSAECHCGECPFLNLIKPAATC